MREPFRYYRYLTNAPMRGYGFASVASVTALLLAFGVAGCGGGSQSPASSTATNTATNPVPTGRVVVRFDWPTLTLEEVGQTRAIPRFARTIKVQVQQLVGGTWTDISGKGETRQRPESATATQEVFTFGDIPRIPGEIRLVAQALDGGGTVMGSVEQIIGEPDFNAGSINLVLASTVTALTVQKAADPLPVLVGRTQEFTVVPTDKEGKTILLSPDTELEVIDAGKTSKDFTEQLIVERVTPTERRFRITGRKRSDSDISLQVRQINGDQGEKRSTSFGVNVKTRIEFVGANVSGANITLIPDANNRRRASIRIGDVLSFGVRGDQNIDSDLDNPNFLGSYAFDGSNAAVPTGTNAYLKPADAGSRQFNFAPQQPGTFVLTFVEGDGKTPPGAINNPGSDFFVVEVTGTPTLSGSTSPLQGAEETYSLLIGNRLPATAPKFYLKTGNGDYTQTNLAPGSLVTDPADPTRQQVNNIRFRVPLGTTATDTKYTIGVVIGGGTADTISQADWNTLLAQKLALELVATVKPVTFDITPGADTATGATPVASRVVAFDAENLAVNGAAFIGTPVVTWSATGGGAFGATVNNAATFTASNAFTSGVDQPATITATVDLTPQWTGATPVTFTKQEYIRVKSGAIKGTIQ